MKKWLFEDINFADSEYHSLEFEGNNLRLTLIAWDEQKINLIFSDTIQFVYKLGDITQGIVEIFDNKDFLEEGLIRNYEKIPLDHPYHLFQILDIYDYPYIEIVAANVNATKSPT